MFFKRLLKPSLLQTLKQQRNYTVLGDQVKLSDKSIKNIGNDKFLRLVVDAGGIQNQKINILLEGCGGFVYKFKFDQALEEEDHVLKQEDKILFAVDGLTLRFVEGCVIDFEIDMMRQAFQVVANPNSEKNCSCKASFTPKESLFE